MYYLARRLCNGDTLFKKEVFMFAFKRISGKPKFKPPTAPSNGGNVMLSKRLN